MKRPTAPIDGALAALAALALVLIVAPRVAGFTTDSDSYLDVARGLLEGKGLVQHAVDFWRPAVPDPLGMWPPLYPALVALVAAFGVPLDLAGRAVSAVSFAAFAFAFHALAVSALGRGVGALAVVATLASLTVTRLGASAWSEATFLAFLTAGTLLAARAEEREDFRNRGMAVVTGLLFALAALTRYIGFPVVTILVTSVAFGSAFRGRRLAFVLPALLPPFLWGVRCHVLFGRPTGPPLPASSHLIGEQSHEFLRALRYELLPAPFDTQPALALALTALVVAGIVLALRGSPPIRLAWSLAFGFAASVLLATSTTAINAPTGRYLAPVLPFLLLAIFGGWRGSAAEGEKEGDPGVRRTLATALTATWAIAAALEGLGELRALPAQAPEALARRDARAAVARLVTPTGAPVLSDRGQFVRAATGRSAVQIPAAAYRASDYDAEADARWERAGVNEAIFADPAGPPAGRWVRAGTAGPFTRWVRD